MSCLLHPGACIQTAFWDTLSAVPLWGWIALVVALLFVAWRLGGIAGLVAAAGAIGFVFGRFRPPAKSDAQQAKRAAPNPDRKPDRPPRKVSDFWKKMHGE